MKKLLIANRGEIAIRIARTATELGLPAVCVFAEDDADSLHVRFADTAVALKGKGVAAYLDVAQIVAAAKESGCDAIHPGYGFLSENAALAQACFRTGVTFVGPAAETLSLFGDKVAALGLAERLGVPVLPGTRRATSLAEAEAFLTSLGRDGAIMLKALAGGGGRGMRPVRHLGELTEAFERCASEAKAAFGDGALYVEQFFPLARHVEVQIVGDGTGAVVHLFDRECSLQRQRQKLVEVAPALDIANGTREALFRAAADMGKAVRYRGLGTIEFLVNAAGGNTEFVFMEANPRLQVEHTVTEAVTGLDLVALQLKIASGAKLSDIGLGAQERVGAPRGTAIQCRVNLETMTAKGEIRPSSGVLTAYDLPSGPGIRIDGFGYVGYRTSARYDSLLAKLVVHGETPASALRKAYRSLREFNVSGAATNLPFLRAIVRQVSKHSPLVHTRYVEEQLATLLDLAELEKGDTSATDAAPKARAGARVDASDPLAVLAHGKQTAADINRPQEASVPDGTAVLRAPLQGTVISVAVSVGDTVRVGQTLLIIESMKMEHVVEATTAGTVRQINTGVGETVLEGDPLIHIEEVADASATDTSDVNIDLDAIRPDLAESIERHRLTLDAARPDAVARRRKTNQRTARENIDDLLDPGSFVEYSGLVIAARRLRNTLDDLIRTTPADGLIMGLGSVNGDRFGEDRARCAVMSYDYTVLAGTQGSNNHWKLDRMAELAERWRLPVVFFTEGGGGRPGDTEGGGFIRGFEFWGRLSGAVPLVGVNSGRCFAGNAAILGCCDVIIATRNSTLGMGGPAMVEGGGLGVFKPEEIGPVDVMQANGTIDVLVEDDAEAVVAARKYLSYFQGPLPEWSCADQRLLRNAIPENRLRAYDVRKLIELLADAGSTMELRPKFGLAMVTALIRIEGRTFGVIANNPMHLGGAIDSDAADKAARFLQLCEAFDIPIVSLSDTPGNMVGPEAEKTGLIRHCSRLFVIGANLTVPLFAVILRKSYGLGAIAMTGGSYQNTVFTVAWPTGEFGGMGLEGSVKLGYRNELAAIADPKERKAKFDEMVADAYARGKALSQALSPALDDVIDPAETRRWIMAGVKSMPPRERRKEKKLRWIDTW